MKAKRKLVDRQGELSVRRQCDLLKICRSGLYYAAEPTSTEQLELMKRIDEIHLEIPFYGSRKITRELKAEGVTINRKRVQRLMQLMRISAVAPKPDTSKPAPEHAKFPYLLRNLAVTRPNQVWAPDITYIPMAHGFVYLVAIMDWYSRRVLSWRISTTLSTDFCVGALNDALEQHGKPDIFNSDQGSQFTDAKFVHELRSRGIKISMDGKGRYLDNIFIERLWRSVKYEEVYLHAYDTVNEAKSRIGAYMKFYNEKRFHQALGYQTPAAFHDGLASLAA